VLLFCLLKLLVLLDALLLMLLLQMMRSDMSLAADDACMPLLQNKMLIVVPTPMLLSLAQPQATHRRHTARLYVSFTVAAEATEASYDTFHIRRCTCTTVLAHIRE